MIIKPIKNEPTFTKYYLKTIKTSYGKRIMGGNDTYTYDVYIRGDKDNIEHKLYYVKKGENWVKSRLLIFKNNKLEQEIRSRNAKLDNNTDF